MFGQSPYSIDTSYTVKSVYNKLIIKYPYITIPQKKTSNCVQEIEGIVYNNENNRALHLFYTH